MFQHSLIEALEYFSVNVIHEVVVSDCESKLSKIVDSYTFKHKRVP